LATVIICVALLAIGLGVGLGLSLKNNGSSSSGTSANPTTIPTPNTTSTSTSISSNPSSLSHKILNDTSIAAITTIDGNRNVFFQASNGSLQHTVFDTTFNTWAQYADFVLTPLMPRNNTPLAAISIAPGEISLLYVSSNNSLTAARYVDTSSNEVSTPMNYSLLVAENTKVLSLTTIPFNQTAPAPDALQTLAKVMMLYEKPNSNITLLEGTLVQNMSSAAPFLNYQWLWKDVSEIVYSQLEANNLWAGPPVSLYFLPSGTQPNDMGDLYMTFFNNYALTNESAPFLYSLTSYELSNSCTYPKQILMIDTNAK
jgi:hypothetical protein